MHAEQPRQRETVDVGVDGGGIVAERRERGGQIGGDRRFADAAFAGGDGEDAGFDAGFVERVLFTFGFEVGDQLGEFVSAHGADFDVRKQLWHQDRR